MGLFDKLKKPQEPPKPQRSGVMELLFCPAQSLEDIMGRMEKALGVQGPGGGNRISIYQDDIVVTFTGFFSGEENENGEEAKKQLQGVWAYFRQIKTEKVDIQRNLLYHLRQCKGLVQVNGVYDGPQNAAKEEAITERMCAVTEALQGVLTWGMDALVNSKGQIILNKESKSDLEYYMPLEIPVPADWAKNAPPESLERRDRSMELLREKHIYVTPWLPLLSERAADPGRTVEEVCGRAAALLVLSLYSECRVGDHMSYEKGREFVAPIIESYGAEEFFSPEEKKYLDDPDSTEQTQIQFAWQYENLWVMEWALGLTDDLFWPTRICDVPGSVRLMSGCHTMEELLAAAKLRPRKELLDQADLIYRLRWACEDARVMGMPAPAGIDSGVVLERHRSLFWLAGCDDISMSDCLFYKIANGEIPSKKVYEDELCYAFYDIDPQAPVHFLVIPKAHIDSCAAVTPENSAVVAHIFEVIAQVTKEQGISSFRVVSNCGEQAGQSVLHLHFHVLAGRDMTWPPG